MDKIIVKGLKIFAYHGVNEEEKINGQNFILDIMIFLNIKKNVKNDDINSTVSYSKLVKFVTGEILKEKYNLIETVTEKLAEEILKEFKSIKKIKILLKKPEAPMSYDLEYAAVEITRKRSDII